MSETCVIADIQRYCIHDGNGIRTTLFFKGCPLHCRWCHNPETQCREPVLLDQPERCTGCEACEIICPSRAISVEHGRAVTDRTLCRACHTCTEFCVSALREISGQSYTVRQLFSEVKKDELFYQQSGGGVTFSGGEVMCADMDFVEALAKKLHKFGITITIDTCGFTPWENFERILPYTDTFLYDLKLMDDALHRKYTGVSNQLILSNLIRLSQSGANIYLRIPVIREVNGNENEIQKMIDFLKREDILPDKICLLPYHNTGSAKYQRLGIPYEGETFSAPSEVELETMKAMFQNQGFIKVQVGG